MSIKSTHYCTREFALAAIQKKLEDATDDQLANILEEIIHNGFYNFQIVTEDELEENKKSDYPTPYLTNIDSLPEYNDAH